jgi:tRNA threonylcarbamoyladenosine biosynthesis protein TsaE
MAPMNQQLKFACKTVEETQSLGNAIGSALRGGEVIEFTSDLGGGKTTFVKGLAKGMGVTDVVQSPTFIISSLHKAERGLELHHFDFYRLNDAGIMAAELTESLQQSNAVVAVEWGDIVHNVLPDDRMTVNLTVPEGETRVITISLPEKYQRVLGTLKKYQERGNVA